MMAPDLPRWSSRASLIVAIAASSGLLIGYNTAVIAPVLEPITRTFALTATLQGVVVAAVLAGGLIGSLIAGGQIRRVGEKPVLIATAALFVIGPIGSALSNSMPALLIWRLVVGLGVGGATMVVPLYVSETAPVRLRGALVSSIQLTITIGILLSYVAGTTWTTAGWWQAMLAVGMLPAAVMMVGCLAVPESPRWLLLHGRRAEAARAHQWLGLDREAALPTLTDTAATGNWRDLFRPRNRMVLMLAAGLFAFANLSGIDAILYYAPTIFAEVGFHGALGPILATTGIGCVNVVATIVAMGLIDRLGRRPLLIGGLVPMVLSLLVLAVALLVGRGSDLADVTAAVCLGIFVMAFAVSLGPLPYVLMSELFPLALRGPGMGIASATAWGVNVLVSLTFPLLVQTLGIAWTFGCYGLISIAALAFVVALVPETRGRTLELIETNLGRGRRARDLGQPLTTDPVTLIRENQGIS